MSRYPSALAFFAALMEAGCLYLLYRMACAGGGLPGVGPWAPVLVVLASVLLNTFLCKTGPHWFWLWLVNLAVGGLVVAALIWFVIILPLTLGGAARLLGAVSLAGLAGWLWLRAAILTRHPPDAVRMSGIFDLSAILLIMVLLVSELAGLVLPGWPWITLGLLGAGAAGLALVRPCRGGTVAAGLGLILLPPATVLALAYPWLAGAGQRTFDAAQPLVDGLREMGLAVLLWLLKHGHYVASSPVGAGNAEPGAGSLDLSPLPEAAGAGGSGPVAEWVAIAVGIIITAVGLAVGTYLLWRWLKVLAERAGRYSASPRGEGRRGAWLDRVMAWCRRLWRRVAGLFGCKTGSTKEEALVCYRSLLRWGRWHGCPRRPHETPAEYQAALVARFPEGSEAVSCLTAAYVRHCYGPSPTFRDDGERSDLRRALRDLRRIGCLKGWKRGGGQG